MSENHYGRSMVVLLSFLLTAILLLSPHPTEARLNTRFPRQVRKPPSPLTTRQYKLRRSTTDTCAYIHISGASLSSIDRSAGYAIPADELSSISEYACVCDSGVSSYISSDPVLSILGDTVTLVNFVQNLIATAPGSQTCTFPTNGVSSCTEADPCGFSCVAPYVAQGSSCVCDSPYTLCNGVCGSFPSGCGSQTPTKKRTYY